ncbi:Anoctamin/TMEM 16 [Penicillium cf. griseofulvum]|nr:Anoctamin/TMEM 16 [Penicillium cf. griseofulvum]
MSCLAGYGDTDEDDNDNLGVDWVLQYDFGNIDQAQAITEFRTLIDDLTEAGLRVQVRHGHGQALLVCIRVPRDHLGNLVHQSRIKDWLFGITHILPDGDETAIADADTPSEEIRSVYHAVTWAKEIGGAGITPGVRKWENITASFPLHDQDACAEMLRQWNRKTVLTTSDLDTIRALFGEKVAFYYAFIHCYSLFLVVPAALGILGWLYLGPYSIVYGAVLCAWCIVFVEYWKIREADLSQRWDVKGVGRLKVNRRQYVWEKEVKDSISGQVKQVFPSWKQFTRQLLLVPFASVTSVALGALIVASFASEVFISEVYDGPFKGYLEFVPTVLFSLSLPAITSFLTNIATRLTEYENYRTQDQYDLAQTQKSFVMNFITSFLPTILTAYVYVPFGKQIIPKLDVLRRMGFRADLVTGQKEFEVDTSRFQQEVIYLSMTAQVFSFCEEVVLPYVKHVLRQKWQNYRDRKVKNSHKRKYSTATDLFLVDPPDEAAFMTRLRSEAGAEEYHVEEDIMEMCVQFGYLALFGVAWPLVPLGFLLNNWLELRGDFFKLTLECQRPPPIRSDSIGPCLLGLDLLAWMGTLSTAAIVHVYKGPISEVRLSSLLLTLFVAEQVYLGTRFTVSTALEKIFSGTIRREEASLYAVRKNYLATSLARNSSPSSGSQGSPNGRTRHRVRFNERVNVYSSNEKDPSSNDTPSVPKEEPGNDVLRGSDREAQFWSTHSGDMADIGVKLICALSTSTAGNETKVSKEA